MALELTEALLSKAAGWEAMKQARAYLAQEQVLSAYWAPPLLRGVVQTGELSFRASLVIKSDIDMENLCTCRDAREWGKICPHVVAVGLHWLKNQQTPSAEVRSRNSSAPVKSPAKKTLALLRDPAGEPTQLFIILPPNLDQAIARGKIMLVLEAKAGPARCPLNALPKSRSYAFSSQDSLIIDRVATLADGETPGMLQPSSHDFASLLPLLVNHPNITLGKTQPVTVTGTPLPLPLLAELQTNGEIILRLESPAPAPQMIEGWAWNKNTFQPLSLVPVLKDLFRGPVRIPRVQIPEFLNQQWPQLITSSGVKANFKSEDFAFEPQVPRFSLELKGGLAQLSGLLQCAYGQRIMTVGVTSADEAVWLPDPDVPTRYSTRDLSAERAALGRLQHCGFSGPDAQGKLQLLGENAVLNFFAREFPKLQREWSVTLEERLGRSTAQNLERIQPQFQITPSGIQWFDLGVVFASDGGQTFSPAEIQRLLLSGQSHTRLRNGKLALIDSAAVDELQEVLRDCAPQQHDQGYRISNTQAGFLESTLKQRRDWRVQAPQDWRDRAAKQSGEAKLECPPLDNLDPVLRPYQKQGVAWLHFLRSNAFSGILADEMGLGKTLQTLALLRFVRQQQPGGPPMLVVCPTSLVFNWVAEAKKFTPSLKLLALQGSERHALFAQVPEHDLILTSYALIRRDWERYRQLEFDTVVLDEAQHIKNRQTQNAQAVKSIKSQHRLVLTGTPLENSVLDLWSIFDFLMPGYLGGAQDFRDRYETPITRQQDEQAQRRLSRRLRPFMLRRLKREVAADLPPKVEQISYCELSSEQRSVYQQIIEASRKEILETAGQQGTARGRMMVLSALLRLRQTCCDLRLLKLENTTFENASGKLELFGELLQEVLDGGHRVLVFSQFVTMLALLKETLMQQNIEFCYLDGSTADREAVVQRFQKDGSVPVFLISLKAGGTGLNLTGADTVIHFDPWWNPAVEAQATDRAHRIGQNRVVTSYKLITRDTVEEKILTLQNRKREIIQATIGDEEQFLGALNWEEIQELLS